MRFRYLEDAMEYIVVEHPEKVWCDKHQAWSGLMVKDSWSLALVEQRNRDRFKIVTKCCEEEVST